MSDTGDRGIRAAVDGFEELNVTEVDGHEYRVLSWRNDSVTAHRVNVRELSCTCEDEEYNTEGNEVCAHLARALFDAPVRPDMTEAALWSLVNHHDRLLNGTQADPEPTEGQASDDDVQEAVEASEAMQEAAADLDRVQVARDWLDTGFAQPEHVDLYVTTHDGVNGVALEPDNQAMPDHVYESFKGIVNSVDGSTVHVGFGDDPCNTCGQQDGEFWYHIPDDELEGLADEG